MAMILEKIKQFLPYLTSAETKIANYILENPSASLGLTITELAEAAKASTTAVIRLCKKLDFIGYSEFRRELSKEVYSKEQFQTAPYILNNKDESHMHDISEVIIHKAKMALDSLESVLSNSNLNDAIFSILDAKNILLSGIGASGLVAMDLNHKLTRIGIFSSYPIDSDLQIVQACSLCEKDVAIFVSYSGETPQIIKAAKEAKKRNARIISITRIGNNTLSRISDIILNVPDTETLYRQGATFSRLTQMLVVDILYTGLINERQDVLPQLASTWKAVSKIEQ